MEGEEVQVGEVNCKDTNGLSSTENGSNESVECEVVKTTVTMKKCLVSESTDTHQESNGCDEELDQGSNSEDGTAMNGKGESEPVDSFSDCDEDVLFDAECTNSTLLVESQSLLELGEKNLLDRLENRAESVVEVLISNGSPENVAQHIDLALDDCDLIGTEVSDNVLAPDTGHVNGLDDSENLEERRESLNREKDMLTELDVLRKENADLATQLEAEREKKSSMDEIIKEMEKKCFHQQERVEELELGVEETLEKAQQERKTLQEEIIEAQQSSVEASKSRDSVISKLALLQEEHRNLVDQITDKEKRVRELTKELEKLEVLSKKQRAEVLKLQANLEKSELRCTQLSQDLNKHKEEVNSVGIKLKWTQNKLKTEGEAHKTTKVQLDLVTKKLNQAKEEGDMIRADLKKMINQYQESEEMRSNSLDIKLKKTEEELKQHEQEIADQHELHELTVKELELTKTSHKIALEEIQQRKQKMTEIAGRNTELVGEIEELKLAVTKLKQENRKQSVDASENDQKVQAFEKERVKFSQLREVFTQLQKSHQHMEKELDKRKERETELLAFSAKLSSSNAELMAERQEWETKLSTLTSERETLEVEVNHTSSVKAELQERLEQSTKQHQQQLQELLQQLDSKSRAVEELSLSLEDERELVKATKKKNINVVKDLQRQLQNSSRRVEHLEAVVSAEKEPPAMLPISHALSTNSLDTALPTTTPTSHTLPGSGTPPTNGTAAPSTSTAAETSSELRNESLMRGTAATFPSSDDDVAHVSPSPEYKFYNMDQEKILLVEKMCHLKRELAKHEEKAGFYEDHVSQLTEDIKKKSRIIQSFIVREQSGALAPPSFDENRIRQSRKGGVMGSVFSGKNRSSPEINLELSLEMNRKMQSVLEDTLLKNITLKENIDTLGQEIQRISAQLQTYETSSR